jgi:hypothetical protein
MARNHNKTGRTRTPPFAMLPHYVLTCTAWRGLSLAARAIFIEFLALYLPGRNGRIGLSARTAAGKLPVSRATATRALQELVAKGFIEPVKPGGFNMKSGTARATEWRLTLYKCDVTAEAASKAFMRWRAGAVHSSASPEGQPGLTTGSQAAKKDCIPKEWLSRETGTSWKRAPPVSPWVRI